MNQHQWLTLQETQLKPLLAEGRLADAIELLSVANDDNQHVSLMMTLANLLAYEGSQPSCKKALDLYQKVSAIDPYYEQPYFESAKTHIKLGDKTSSLDCLLNALYLDPHHPDLTAFYDEHFGERKIFKGQMPDIIFFTGQPFRGAQHNFDTLPYPSELGSKAVGGSESVLFIMAKQLASAGKRVAIFGPFEKSFHEENGIEYYDLRDFFVVARQQVLPVTIVLRFFQPFLKGFRAIKRIFWLQDIVTEDSRNHYQSMDAFVDEYWVLSDYQKNNYVQVCGLDEKKFWKTTNVFDEDFGYSTGSGFAERFKLGQIIYASRPNRGLKEAILTFEKLKKDFPHLTLKLATYSTYPNITDDPELAPVLPELSRLNLKVERLGKNELVKELSKSLLLLYPNVSLLETSCMTAIEAMACGTPVVTTNRGCLSETVNDGKSGLVLPWPDQSQDLTESLSLSSKYLLSNPPEWEKISVQAHKLAFERFSSRKEVRRWLERLFK